jgi:hypothetical protein
MRGTADRDAMLLEEQRAKRGYSYWQRDDLKWVNRSDTFIRVNGQWAAPALSDEMNAFVQRLGEIRKQTWAPIARSYQQRDDNSGCKSLAWGAMASGDTKLFNAFCSN